MRHRPDGSVWVRTFPLTLLHDHTLPTHTHDWDQLTYATSGVLRVATADASWVVPPHRAVWVPAGIAHAEQMFAPVSVRTLYFAPRIAATLPRECRTLNISSLLRELILHVSRLGALDRRTPSHARIIGVLLDQMSAVSEVPLQLPLPRDARGAGTDRGRKPEDARAAVRARDGHDGGRVAAPPAAAARGQAAGGRRTRDDRRAGDRLLERERVHRRLQESLRRHTEPVWGFMNFRFQSSDFRVEFQLLSSNFSVLTSKF